LIDNKVNTKPKKKSKRDGYEAYGCAMYTSAMLGMFSFIDFFCVFQSLLFHNMISRSKIDSKKLPNSISFFVNNTKTVQINAGTVSFSQQNVGQSSLLNLNFDNKHGPMYCDETCLAPRFARVNFRFSSAIVFLAKFL
jgi:hypothetical protein